MHAHHQLEGLLLRIGEGCIGLLCLQRSADGRYEVGRLFRRQHLTQRRENARLRLGERHRRGLGPRSFNVTKTKNFK